MKPDTIIGWEYYWCGMELDGGDCGVCVIPTLFGYFFVIPSLHAYALSFPLFFLWRADHYEHVHVHKRGCVGYA